MAVSDENKRMKGSYPADALLIMWKFGEEVRVPTNDGVTEQVLNQIEKPWFHDQVPNAAAKLVPIREFL